MKRPRDSQRSKLYEAEGGDFIPKGNHLPTVAAIQSYVDGIVGSRWWKNRFTITTVYVEDGRSHRTALAFCSPSAGWITMPRWTRHERYILHELAHVATPNDCAAHGREFARNFLLLVGRWMGRDAAKVLKASFDQHRVKWRKKRRLSDADRARLSAQMTRIRATRKAI